MAPAAKEGTLFAMDAPVALDIKKDRGLTVTWADGAVSHYPVAYLRRMSPSADMKSLRDEMARNPLAVLPGGARGAGGASGPLVILEAQLRGNYAIWISFSDGHSTGIYSWEYLRQIDPGPAKDQ